MRYYIVFLLIAFNAFAASIDLTQEEKSYLQKKKVISMCIDPSWEPLEYLNKDGIHEGFSADYMKLLEDKLNIKIKVFKTKSWSESLKAFADKKCDIFSQIAKTPSRLKTMLFTPPYVTIPNVIIGTTKQEYIHDIHELEGKRIGVIEGYAYVEILKNAHPELTLVMVKNTKDGLSKVSGYQIDVMIDFVSSASFYIDKLSLSNLKFVGRTKGMDLSLGISSHIDQKMLINILSKGVNSISKEKIQVLKKRWINIEIKQDDSLLFKVLGISSLVLFILLLWSITLKRAIRIKTEKLVEGEKYSRMLFETSPVGLALCGMDGELIDVNSAYCDIIGYDKEEALNLSYWDVTPKSYEVEEGLQLESLNAKGHYGPYEKHYIHKNGTHIPVRLNGQIIERDGVQYIWSSIEDITEAKANELKLKDTNAFLEEKVLERTEALEKASEAKSNFLATMSHELRTPLNGIIGPVELLKAYADQSSEQNELLEIAETSAKQMYLIINDILDFTKIEAGELNFENIEFDLEHRIKNIVSILKPQVQEKEIFLSYEIDDSVSKKIIGDPTRLTQILINLVNNSVKFTQVGGVEILVSSTTSNDVDFLEFEVKDSGIGIEQSKIDQLFVPFFQADSSTTRLFGGTGLGLTIVKKLIEMQGGRIECESEVGKGSIFKFTLPLLSVDKVNITTPQKCSLYTNRTEFNILAVEDNSVNQLVIKKLLSKLGHKVTLANNGLEAVELVKKSDFDLILMDWRMPEMDGIEATKMIRSYGGKFTDLPIYGLTANVFDDDRAMCIKAGMNDVLNKPLTLEVLNNTLNKVLNS